MDRTVGISMVCGDEVIAKNEGGGTGIDEGEGKSDLLGEVVVVGSQRFPESVERICIRTSTGSGNIRWQSVRG